ncbi:restriction endonuclease subunit S [Nodosilinea sp. LEGE 07298]|uniref:restriction endonuclease subunit S n=1 Tax=Nodosilinea sp. LEGE 07298 TaxID=2777970 RepID=UPI0037C9D4D9
MMIYPSELTNKWPHYPLADVVDFLDSKRKPITQKDRVPGPYPYYGANGQQDSVADFIFDEPLVLLAEDGGHFGDPTKTIAYQVEGKCWVNNHAHVLRPKKTIDIRYLCRHLEKYEITSFVNGSTRGKLTKSSANIIPIALPPLEEQRRIAAILDKADAVRRKRKEAVALTEELLRAAFLDMFGDPVTNPKGWHTWSMKDVIESISAGWSAGGEERSLEKDEWGVLKISAVTTGRFIPTEFKNVGRSFFQKQIIVPQKGDLLFTRANTRELVAATCLVEKDCKNLFLPDKIWKIIPKRDIATREYLKFLLSEPKYRSLLTRKATGTSGSMLNVSQKKFGSPGITMQRLEKNASRLGIGGGIAQN